MVEKRITIIYNETAGNFEAQQNAQSVKNSLFPKIDIVSIEELKKDPTRYQKILSEEGYVLVAGGDGTFFRTIWEAAKIPACERQAVLAHIPNGGVNVGAAETTGRRPFYTPSASHLQRVIQNILEDKEYEIAELLMGEAILDAQTIIPYGWGVFAGKKGLSQKTLDKVEEYRKVTKSFLRRILLTAKDIVTDRLPQSDELLFATFNNQQREVVEALAISPCIPHWALYKMRPIDNNIGLLIQNPTALSPWACILSAAIDITHISAELKKGHLPQTITGFYEYHPLSTEVQIYSRTKQDKIIIDSESVPQPWEHIQIAKCLTGEKIRVLRRAA